ncbi:MAG: PD40 domain-containing protein [Ignavibacteria bacterium]|nr:PD40 domain-containing protein [Ignavibacteria bacterium]
MKHLLLLCVSVFVFIACYTGYSQEGFYKRQYDVFEWQSITSKNTEVYYTENNLKIAEFAAQNAERALEYLKWKLGLPQIDLLQVFIYGSHNEFQQTNLTSSILSEGTGGFTELKYSRIVIPFSGDYDEFRHVIYHEVVHSYLNKYLQENASFWSSSIWGTNLLPYWLNEGIADYFSKGSTMDYETDMYMRSYLFGSKAIDPENLYGYSAYRYGEAFCNWLTLRYDRNKLSTLIKEYTEKPKNKSKNYKVTKIVGYHSITTAFQDELKKIYNEEADKFQTPDIFGDIVKRAKVTSNYYTTNPQISPDGKKIIYIGNDNDALGLYIHDVGSPKKNRILIDGWSTMGFQELVVSKHTVSWHPSSEKFVFTAKTNGYDQLYIYNIKTEDYEQRYLNFRSIQSTHWSPDGNSIVISALKNNQQDIFIYSLSDNSLIQCTNDIYYDQSAVWSRDGKSIFFTSRREKSAANINSEKEDYFSTNEFHAVYKYSVLTKSTTQLTSFFSYRIERIVPSSNDSNLMILHDKNGIYNVYRYNIEKRNETPLSNTRYAIKDFSLSYDNSKLAFTAYNGTGIDLFVLNDPNTKKATTDTLPFTRFKLFNINPKRFPLFTKDSVVKDSSSVAFTLSDTKTLDSMNMRIMSRYPMMNEINFPNPLAYDDFSVYLGYSGFSFTPTINSKITFRDLFRDKNIYTYLTIGGPTLAKSDTNAPPIMYRASLYYEMKDYIIDYTFRLYRSSYIFPNYTETGVFAEGEYVLDQKQKLQLSTFILSADRPNQGAVFFTPTLNYTYNTRKRHSSVNYTGNYVTSEIQLSPAIGKYGANFGLWTISASSDHYLAPFTSIGFDVNAGTSFGNAPPAFRIGGTPGWIVRPNTNPYLKSDLDNLAITESELFPTLQDAVFHQRYFVRGYAVNQLSNENFVTGSVYVKLPVIILGSWASFFYDIGTAFKSFDEIGVPQNTVIQSIGAACEYNLGIYTLRLELAYSLNSYPAIESPYTLMVAYGTYF